MNLVKAQDLAKSLPLAELQKYANGFQPEVIPPWVAAGEMQAKMATQQKLANMQGAAQGQQPSVKEQIEQKAGLMALQQQQQAQAQQAMMQQAQRSPMPVPGNIPQPEAQPQTFMAARGGLARLPVQFGFNGGGIVAFSGEDGSYVDLPDGRRIRKSELTDEERAMLERQTAMYIEGAKATPREVVKREAAAPKREDWEIMQEELQNPEDTSVDWGRSDDRRAMAARGQQSNLPGVDLQGAAVPKRLPQAPQRAPQRAPISSGYQGVDGQAINATRARTGGISDAALAQGVAPMGGARGTPKADDLVSALARIKAEQGVPQAGPTGAMPRMPQESSFKSMAEGAANALNQPAPTPESAIAQSNKLMPGVASEEAQKALYEGQRKRISDLQAQYAASKPDALDDLIRVFGQSGQYKGLSGLAPAYTQNQEAKRMQDLNFAAKVNELMGQTEKSEQEGAMKTFEKRSDLYKNQTDQHMQNLRQRSAAIAQMYNVDQGRIDNILRNMTSIEVAKIQAAAQGRKTEAERFFDMYVGLKAQDPTGKLAAQFLDTIGQIKGVGKVDPRTKNPGYIAAAKDAEDAYGMALRLPAGKARDAALARAKALDERAKSYLQDGKQATAGVNSELFNQADAILAGGR